MFCLQLCITSEGKSVVLHCVHDHTNTVHTMPHNASSFPHFGYATIDAQTLLSKACPLIIFPSAYCKAIDAVNACCPGFTLKI